MPHLTEQGQVDERPRFRMARNPDPDSRVPRLVWLPIECGLVLKARETWPHANRVFCARDPHLGTKALAC